MKENCPSTTAWRVALRRAAHQLFDVPIIFNDPPTMRIVGANSATTPQSGEDWLAETPLSRVLRASLAARSQCVEDEFRLAAGQGGGQLVVLWAGLDTFAYRNPTPENRLHIFEVDHPATQAWKHKQLEETGMPIPPISRLRQSTLKARRSRAVCGKLGLTSIKKHFFMAWGERVFVAQRH